MAAVEVLALEIQLEAGPLAKWQLITSPLCGDELDLGEGKQIVQLVIDQRISRLRWHIDQNLKDSVICRRVQLDHQRL